MVLKMLMSIAMSVLIMINDSIALPTRMERMTVSRVRMADLETSASGYTYKHQPGEPASYVRYTNHGTDGYYDAQRPIQYLTYRKPDGILHSGSSVFTPLSAYKTEASALPPGYVVPLLQAPNKPALAPYYVPVKVHPELDDIYEDHDNEDEDNSEENGSDEESDENEEEEQDHGGHFDTEGHSAHGEHGDEGYKSHHKFDRGEKGEHHNDNDEGHYRVESGNEKSHNENSGHYDNYDDADSGSKGESHGQREYHKKGHKTTGFHNVYRKDEYKKDSDFYDDENKSGHYDKHSSHGQHHSSAEGGHQNGGQHDFGYVDRESGKVGNYDKGHIDNRHNGFQSEKGDDSHHNNHATYGAESDAQDGKKYGYTNHHL